MARQESPAENFGTALRRLRLARGLTQRDLAMAIGRSQRSVQHLEAGAYAPSARAWHKLRQLLGDELPVP